MQQHMFIQLLLRNGTYVQAQQFLGIIISSILAERYINIYIFILYMTLLIFLVSPNSALGGTVTQLYDQQPIYFGANEPKVLTKGLLATMRDHKWYSKKFLHEFQSDLH